MVPGVTSMPQSGGSGEVVVAPGKLVDKKQQKLVWWLKTVLHEDLQGCN